MWALMSVSLSMFLRWWQKHGGKRGNKKTEVGDKGFPRSERYCIPLNLYCTEHTLHACIIASMITKLTFEVFLDNILV